MAKVEGSNLETLERSALTQLWKQHGFPGQAPAEGTVAAERLQETCRRYITMVNTRLATPVRTNEDVDPENYRPPEVQKMYATKERESSDKAQRDLHNQIAIMIFGESRSNMNEDLAIKISNFAHEVAGDTIPNEN